MSRSGTSSVACDDGVGCTTDSCNEATDSCDATPTTEAGLGAEAFDWDRKAVRQAVVIGRPVRIR